MKIIPVILAACSSLLFVSCEKKSESETTNPPATTSGLESIVLKSAPADAKSIGALRSSPATPGASITLKGKVIGSTSPFVAGRAMVLMGDPEKLTSCDIKHGDRCSTPWDVCCDDKDDIKNFTATIQVVDADGKLIKQGLKGLGGIKELSHLVVTGTIAEGSNADNLLINATGIYVQP